MDICIVDVLGNCIVLSGIESIIYHKQYNCYDFVVLGDSIYSISLSVIENMEFI